RYRIEFQNIYDFLLVIYDMNHDKESYYWNARKIVNTDETANEAFVRLVSGMGTTGNEFFEKRAGAGEYAEVSLNRHFYSEPSRREANQEFVEQSRARFADLQNDRNKRAAAADENRSMILGIPFPRVPVRPRGLVVSEDGLSWREPSGR